MGFNVFKINVENTNFIAFFYCKNNKTNCTMKISMFIVCLKGTF